MHSVERLPVQGPVCLQQEQLQLVLLHPQGSKKMESTKTWLVMLQPSQQHPHNLETRFYCLQTALSLDFQCRHDDSESK